MAIAVQFKWVPKGAIWSLTTGAEGVEDRDLCSYSVYWRENWGQYTVNLRSVKVKMRKKTETKIQLQDYGVLLENPYRLDFTVDQLNQVIQMHGFVKLHKRRKEELLEALSTIDLMHPRRSTLNERSSPYDSSLTIDQVNKDLEALEWQECPVQSLQTLAPSKTNVDGAGNDVFPMFKIGVKKPRTKKRIKMRRISDLSRGLT